MIEQLLRDESGLVLSAEAVTIGTVGVLGSIVGMNAFNNAVNDELKEMACAIRSLDQSYAYAGQRGCGAWTAGSCYIQPDVQQSLAEISADGPVNVKEIQERINADRKALQPQGTEVKPVEPKAEPLPNQIPVPEPKKPDGPQA
jgi:hypothetical protein